MSSDDVTSRNFLLLPSLVHYITLRYIKIKMQSLFGQLIRALFFRQTNKRHIYETPLQSSYFV